MAVLYEALSRSIRSQTPISLATIVSGPGTGKKMLVGLGGRVEGTLGNDDLDRVVERDTIGELAAGRSGMRHYGENGQAREEALSVFVESFAPAPQMLIFGAVDFTGALARIASVLGYRVTVCDARAVFATPSRFPMAHEVVVDWPNRLIDEVADQLGPRDAICILTHDVKFDIPAVLSSLDTEVGYIGVMGSRRTHAARTERLREAGVDDIGLARLCSPIGLDIGARTPEETAVSIVSEIIGRRTGRQAKALSTTEGPIHG